MMFQAEVVFEEKNLPSPEEVLERVRQISGLVDVLMIKKDYYQFEHHIFSEIGFMFYPKENKYKLFIWKEGLNYMVEVTIAALVDLGGIFEHEIYAWSHKTWEEVKHLF